MVKRERIRGRGWRRRNKIRKDGGEAENRERGWRRKAERRKYVEMVEKDKIKGSNVLEEVGEDGKTEKIMRGPRLGEGKMREMF